jgi:hypothetical protein
MKCVDHRPGKIVDLDARLFCDATTSPTITGDPAMAARFIP